MPKNPNAKNLYLKGINLNTKEDVDLYKDLEGEKNRKLWQLIVFESGTTKIEKLGEANLEGGEREPMECTRARFIVERPTHGGSDKWERSAASIAFEFGKDCKQESGKTVCDIEIADSVGLKKEKPNT